jgi:hypothetical protein
MHIFFAVLYFNWALLCFGSVIYRTVSYVGRPRISNSVFKIEIEKLKFKKLKAIIQAL